LPPITLQERQFAVTPPIQVLYEDNHVLAIDKPAGLATMGVAAGRDSALAIAKQYVKKKYRKPGNVYLGVMSRLDAAVSGVLLLARTSKAAARLTEQFRQGTVEKIYWALVSGTLDASSAEWSDWLVKDEGAQRMRAVRAGHSGAKLAVLRFRRLSGPIDDTTLIEIQLLTGRKHQIRVQFASRGLPILGDQKYGSAVAFRHGIALHARRLTFEHPTRKSRIEVNAELPAYWPAWVGKQRL
jgi:23S rRNA pseudouridine1911/1915/1917 synthase